MILITINLHCWYVTIHLIYFHTVSTSSTFLHSRFLTVWPVTTRHTSVTNHITITPSFHFSVSISNAATVSCYDMLSGCCENECMLISQLPFLNISLGKTRRDTDVHFGTAQTALKPVGHSLRLWCHWLTSKPICGHYYERLFLVYYKFTYTTGLLFEKTKMLGTKQ